MAEDEHFTVYDAETQRPLMVTVAGAAVAAGENQNIAYINQDSAQNAVFDLTGGVVSQVQQQATTAQQLVQRLTQQQTATGTSTAAVVVPGAPTAALTTAIPQMLFLNQVNINGQTSFVLVDASNKPVQLPQGIQVINLPQTAPANPPTMAVPTESGEEPLYVNAKQYHRILKRRQARAKLEAHGKIPKERQKYMYESRHKHALKRQRGSGGVFVGSEAQQSIVTSTPTDSLIHSLSMDGFSETKFKIISDPPSLQSLSLP